ncbi:MAG: recombination regulator RecX [Bifidobacteriaceae bacterium]|jgi:regulatory protein|nr:recombination regulator RecX [Bifidobacteriaceae bacterium]
MNPVLVDRQEEFARSITLKALDRSQRSRSQLAELLARKDVPAEIAAAVLDRFEEVGLVDDRSLAEALVRTRHAERGLVGRALAAELQSKGIDPLTAADAMAQITEEDELAAAERWAAKKLAMTRGLPTEKRLRQTGSLLMRKGHGTALALSTVKRLLAQELAQENASAGDNARRQLQ